ncbi:hypothetical protein [Blastococcus tunisiensis]|uniref:Antibiotic biosynthesis monooxygenase n=1 Tax=Blastococcus tunisiensis TaxID=1798228 RepID=A0A1I2BEQ5_9ACTN|nr:hypothetical protein [Blastococcus sp. DSM 46838]SFE54654.1 hypothetical protein SAMN05216574_104142 [Blastococcus sp. DSM 46838]
MYARSTTVRGTPPAIDAGIDYVRETVMPTVRDMDGWVGLSMLCDRDTGRCIVTTAWADTDALHGSAGAVAAIRQRTAEILAGDAETEQWEIALLHRRRETHHGACARLIRADGDPDRLEQVLETIRTALLPRIEELPGFVSVSVLVDRDRGRLAAAVSYDSRLSMAEAERAGMSLREEFSGRTGTAITDVAAYDIALAHLRAPETV